MSDERTPSGTERLAHLFALVSIGSLFAIYGMHRLFVAAAPQGAAAVALLALQTMPLLAFLPGLLQGRARAGAQLAFVAMVYFLVGVLTAVDPAQRFSGVAEVFFATTLFFAATLFARHRGQRDTLLAEAAETGTAAEAGRAAAEEKGAADS